MLGYYWEKQTCVDVVPNHYSFNTLRSTFDLLCMVTSLVLKPLRDLSVKTHGRKNAILDQTKRTQVL